MPSLSSQHPVSEAVARRWLLDDLHTALTSSAPVLVSGQGQADVGRLVARTLHERRREARVTPFIEIPHDELPERLAALSTEQERVTKDPPVRRETCTVFVDDVDRLTTPAQEMLQYFLDVITTAKDDTPPAGRRALRLITASREDLGAAVKAGRFRAELFYRLNVIHLAVPATWGIAEGGPLQSLLAGLRG